MLQPHIVLLDNFDSFSYNLVDEFRRLTLDVQVYRNHLPAAQLIPLITRNPNTLLVLSPGPGSPKEAGCMLALIEQLKGKVPMLGICLGHQAIVEAYGGIVSHANEIVHGKASDITMTDHPLFDGISAPFSVARYHSLIATKVPDTLNVIAHVDGQTMAVVHEQHRVIGFQFHPESILTLQGSKLIHNAINWAVNRAMLSNN